VTSHQDPGREPSRGVENPSGALYLDPDVVGGFPEGPDWVP